MTFHAYLVRQLDGCTRCGACLAVCPSYLATGDESLGARGRVNLIKACSDGGLDLTKGLAERLSRCLGCLACVDACPSGVHPQQIIQAAKRELANEKGSWRLSRAAALRLAAAEGRAPAALRLASGARNALGAIASSTSLLSNFREGQLTALPQVAGKPLTELLPEISPATRATARVAFFPGCATNLVYPENGLAAVALLNRAGADVITPRGLKCCGQPLLWLGDEDSARAMARQNLRRLGMVDADAIVTICPSCALGLKEELPRLMGGIAEARRLAGKVVDIHQFLAGRDLRVEGKTRMPDLTKENDSPEKTEIAVTWHDPCHLSYGLKVTAEPREIISSVPGVRYVETPGERFCCGAGGPFSLLHYDLALEIGIRKAEAIASSGADVVATGCPACRAHLTGVLARAGVDVKVVHSVELLNGQIPSGN